MYMVTILNILALDIRCDLGMENISFGLAPYEKTRQVLVVRIRFDYFQRCHSGAKHRGRQHALLETHRHMIRPADASGGQAFLDEGERCIWQFSPWQIRL